MYNIQSAFKALFKIYFVMEDKRTFLSVLDILCYIIEQSNYVKAPFKSFTVVY